MRALDVKEIHGYEPEIGLQILTEQVLEELLANGNNNRPKSK